MVGSLCGIGVAGLANLVYSIYKDCTASSIKGEAKINLDLD